MGAGKRNMPARMPILSGDDMAEHVSAQQLVDARHDRIAFVAGQRTAGHEIRLHVDQDQRGVIVNRMAHGG